MSKTMEDYGMLTKDGQPTERAKEIYISHCEKIAANGKSDLPFGCGNNTKPDPNAKLINLRDKEKYKSFHTNWVNGIYADSLRSINLESNIAIPVFDPLALSAKVDGLKPPNLNFEQSIAFTLQILTLPTLKEKLELTLITSKIEPQKIPELLLSLIPAVSKIIVPVPIPPIPPIPLPSVDFPKISYDVPKFNLLDVKLGIYASIPKAFAELLGMFKEIDFLLGIFSDPIKGPLKAFEAACTVLNKSLPKPPGENSYSSEVFQAAIAASLAKPLAVSTLGSVIGSAEKGITGGLGFISPDPSKIEYYEVKPQAAGTGATLPLFDGLRKNTTPEFRKRLVEITNEINSNTGLGMNADWLVTLMESETGGKYDPALQNSMGAPAYGLIQIMPVALEQIKLKNVANYTIKQVKGMSQVEQLDVVRDYYIAVWKTYSKSLKDVGDLYVANFAPGFMGAADDAVIYKRGQDGFTQNPGFQTGDVIIAGTVRRKLRNLLDAGNRKGRISVDNDETF